MGVKGLTAYVKQYDRSLAQQVDLPVKKVEESPSPSNSTSTNPTFIIDGWAWLYNAYMPNFPKTPRGGQYLEFSQFIRQQVHAWRSVGLNLVFVFDGPAEPKKVPTVVSRINAQCQTNSTTMRFSPPSRNSTRNEMLPPLTYLTSISTLQELGVEIVFAKTEADGIVAELAEKRNGYALSQDSDFFINSSTEKGSAGYVPLDSLEYLWKFPPSEQDETNQVSGQGNEASFGANDGFAPVRSKGRHSRREPNQGGLWSRNQIQNQNNRASSTLTTLSQEASNLTVSQTPPPLPSSSSTNKQPVLASFRFKTYSSSNLASHLDLPSNLLPLLASLCGNDFTSKRHANLLYSNLPRSTAKIPFIAKILREEWVKSLNPKPKRNKGNKSSSSSRLNSGSNTPLLSYRSSLGKLAAENNASVGGSSGPKSDSGRSVKSNATVTVSSSSSSPSKKDQVSKLSTKLSSIALANLTEMNNDSSPNLNPAMKKANSIISESDAQTVSMSLLGSERDVEEEEEEELDPVKSLVKSVIERLLELNYTHLKSGSETFITKAEKEDLIEGVLQGFESYSFLSSQISFLTNPCFEFFNVPTGPSSPSNEIHIDSNPQTVNTNNLTSKRGLEVIKAYNDSYNKGRFDTFLIEVIGLKHWVSKQFWEDPDEVSPQCGPARKLKQWIFAVLFDVWGMDWARKEMILREQDEEEEDEIQFNDEIQGDHSFLKRKKWIGEEGYKSGEDPDDLISVHDESSASGSEFSSSFRSDPDSILPVEPNAEDRSHRVGSEELNPDQILPIRPNSVISNFYKNQDDEDDEIRDQEEIKPSDRFLPPPAITEHVRRGARLNAELIRIRSLAELLKDEDEDEDEDRDQDEESAQSHIDRIWRSNFNPLPSSLGDLLAQHEAAKTNGLEEDVNASISTVKSDPLPPPIPSQSISTRLDLFLVANHSNLKSFRLNVPMKLWPFIASIRFMMIEGASRFKETSKKKNWRRKEIEILLKTGICVSNLTQSALKGDQSFDLSKFSESSSMEDGARKRNLFNMNSTRNIQLTTTIQNILEINHYLSQCLLIDDELGSRPEQFIDGGLLTLELSRLENERSSAGGEATSTSFLPKEGFSSQDEENAKVYLDVVLEGLDEILGVDIEEERRLRRAEKKKAAQNQSHQSGNSTGNNKSNAVGGKKANPFDLLAEM